MQICDMSTSGYSKTPLAKKLGIKEGYIIMVINEPVYYFDLFTDLPAGITIKKSGKHYKNFVHLFATDAKELKRMIPKLKKELHQDGIIWVSWPKKSVKAATDVTENLIREIAISNGLVDVKVCAVDEVWSGLKLVIPLKYRDITK